MLRFRGLTLVLAVLSAAALGRDAGFELDGRIEPGGRVTVALYGTTSPFSATASSDEHGRFRFRKLPAGAYTVAIYDPARGEARVTVDVGPGSANASGRVEMTFPLKDSDFSYADAVRRAAVPARQLAIPERAWREFESAQKDLGRRDANAAEAHLLKAVEMAPQFTTAWNTLGTIAYQTRRYERAEHCFREALAQDATAYDALVNLGGVLINLNQLAEAKLYNERAIEARPQDSLANSQLGMTYYELGDMARSEKYLRRAVEIDPAHFSHPQLILARIHARQNRPDLAASDLEDFLKHHPDWPRAAEIIGTIRALRGN